MNRGMGQLNAVPVASIELISSHCFFDSYNIVSPLRRFFFKVFDKVLGQMGVVVWDSRERYICRTPKCARSIIEANASDV